MSLFIFRHDLRIVDNIGFNKFLLEDKCICVFVLDKEQLFNKWNKSKKVKDLYDLISLQQPEYIDVPDIYTIYTRN